MPMKSPRSQFLKTFGIVAVFALTSMASVSYVKKRGWGKKIKTELSDQLKERELASTLSPEKKAEYKVLKKTEKARVRAEKRKLDEDHRAFERAEKQNRRDFFKTHPDGPSRREYVKQMISRRIAAADKLKRDKRQVDLDSQKRLRDFLAP